MGFMTQTRGAVQRHERKPSGTHFLDGMACLDVERTGLEAETFLHNFRKPDGSRKFGQRYGNYLSGFFSGDSVHHPRTAVRFQSKNSLATTGESSSRIFWRAMVRFVTSPFAVA